MPLPKSESEAKIHSVASFLHENGKHVLPAFQELIADRNDWKRIAGRLLETLQHGSRIELKTRESDETLWAISICDKDELNRFLKEDSLPTI